MDKPMSSVGFKLMALVFRIRDILRPRMDLLKEAGIEPGFCVLDYGCGPGSYIAPLAQLVGTAGVIYALDIHPLAIKEVQKKASRKAIKNLKTIDSDCSTGLPDCKVDVVLLYDIFHDLSLPDEVLRELHRVLKPDGLIESELFGHERGAVTGALFALALAVPRFIYLAEWFPGHTVDAMFDGSRWVLITRLWTGLVGTNAVLSTSLQSCRLAVASVFSLHAYQSDSCLKSV